MTTAYFPPALVAAHARELVVLLALPILLPLGLRHDRSPESPLALLALLFLARCMLDPSNHVYYQLPLVIWSRLIPARAGRPWEA